MPQHVWPSGKSTVTPSRRRSRTMATPISGKNMSPRQVIMIEAFTGAIPPRSGTSMLAAVRRRRRHDDQHEQRIGPVVDEPVLDPRPRDQRVAGREPLFAAAEREPAG